MSNKKIPKEETNKINIEEARDIVLDAIGEKKRREKTKVDMKVSGEFLESVKKAEESLASKMPPAVKLDTAKKIKPEEEKENMKEIVKFQPLSQKQAVKKSQITKKGAGEAKKKSAISFREEGRKAEEGVKKAKTATPEKKTQEKKVEAKIARPDNYAKLHPVFNTLILTFFSAGILFIIIYSAFILFVTRFYLDNGLTRLAADYLPVPAFISKTGIVEYYEYQDILKTSNLPPEQVKLYFFKELANQNKEAGEVDELKVWSLVE